jgi:hypothetical protein
VIAPSSDGVECGEDISIARCRELLGHEAESMTDHDVEELRQHAHTMAWILVEMYEDHRRSSWVERRAAKARLARAREWV